MKRLKKWWIRRRIKSAQAYLKKNAPGMFEMKFSISQYEVKILGNRYKLPRRPSYFDQLSKEEQDRYLMQQVKDCAHGFIDAMLEHELLSVYIEAVDGNPDDLVMTSELKLVKPRYDDDPRYRALTGTLSMDGHPYRVFPRQ